jgi:hypothetical protein
LLLVRFQWIWFLWPLAILALLVRRVRSVAGAQRDGRGERFAAGDESVQATHADPGSRFLDGDCQRRYGLYVLMTWDVRSMISGLDLLFLEVNSLEESLRFMKACSEWKSSRLTTTPSRRWRSFAAANLRITLAQHLETMLRRGRGVHFFVGVEDVDQFYDQLIARGADVLAAG